ncbi:MAG: SBBP repeat-containing protein [Ardenticatenaceae bacterium]|nr:SBBP repeat-containing protein [Ardenticatenaceae bacterium]
MMKKRISFAILFSLFPFLTISALFIPSTQNDPIVYGTFLGAEAAEYGRSIATDPAGNIYITGETQSVTFPTITGTHTLAANHGIDVYVAKFNPVSGAADYIIWFNALTLFAEDYAYGIAVGPDGSAYIAGDTRSDDFCNLFGSVPGFDTTYNGNGDAFVLKIKPDGSGLDYCTFIGGIESDTARAIAIDAEGNAYVTGSTWSDVDFPTTPNAYDTAHNGLRDTFALKLDETGTKLLYSSYIGGAGQEEGVAIVVDGTNQAHISGWTFSADFPTTPTAYDSTHNGGADIFVATFNAAGTDLTDATFLGGALDDRPAGIDVDTAVHTYITGYTYSADFPITPGAFDPSFAGSIDAFVSKFSADGGSLAYSTFLGGTAEDWSNGIDIDVFGNAYLTGRTWSTDFPTTADAYSSALNGGRDGFIAQLSPDGTHLLYGSFLGGSDWDESLAITSDDRQLYVTGTTRSTDFPLTDNAFAAEINGDYDIFALQFALPTANDVVYLPILINAQADTALTGR